VGRKRRGSAYLDLDTAAAELGCSRDTLERHVRAGRLRATKVGRLVRIDVVEWARFLASGRQAPVSAPVVREEYEPVLTFVNTRAPSA
jgi:excisionase family DNA binding protein